MKCARAWSISPLIAAVALWASCADEPHSGGTAPLGGGAGAIAGAGSPGGAGTPGGAGSPAGTGGTQGGIAGASDAAVPSGSLSGGTPSSPGTAGGSPAGGSITSVTVDNSKPCERVVRTAGKTIPDFMIVLDRSQSMKPDCASGDLFASFDCRRLMVNCNQAPNMGTTICGGTMPSPYDRWGPAVDALKSLTKMFETKVNFGLTIFPGPTADMGGQAVCATGTQRVPVGLNTATAIAGQLDMTKPAGYTPTGPTLDEVLKQIQAKKTSPDEQLPPQFVLLVTDGAPTCPGMGMQNAQAHQATIVAIDALAKAGVKTYVIGYDASVDAMLAMQLTEYAQHGGTNNFYAVQDGPSLVAKFSEITGAVVECSYLLDKKPDDKNYVLVELDGKKLNLGDPNGWSIDDRNVTIEGEACTTLRDGSRMHTLAVTVECRPQVLM
jgi:hypothetical protein